MMETFEKFDKEDLESGPVPPKVFLFNEKIDEQNRPTLSVDDLNFTIQVGCEKQQLNNLASISIKDVLTSRKMFKGAVDTDLFT